MTVRGLGHVGFDTSLFSGISARKGGLSTAIMIEAGVPEHILWIIRLDAEWACSGRGRSALRPAPEPRPPLRHLARLPPVRLGGGAADGSSATQPNFSQCSVP